MGIPLQKFKGVVIGSAIGDAIGKSVEDVVEEEVIQFYGGRVEGFVEPHPSSPAVGRSPYEVSDETTIAILLLESLVSRKALDINDYLHRLLLWLEDEKSHRYPDPTLIVSLELLSSNLNPSTYGITSTSVEGILRSVMVGLFHYQSPPLAVEGSKLVSMLTHRSGAVKDGSAVLGSAISLLLLEEFDLSSVNERIRFVNSLKGNVEDPRHRRTLEAVQELLLESADLDIAIKTLGNGSFVFESLPLALFIFLSNIETPLEALWWGVNSYGSFGGDTDSIGFLVGALLGATFGINVFPDNLVSDLEDSARYEDLAEKLYDITENMIIRR